MSQSAASRVRVVSPGANYVGKQGFAYGSGASKETVGAAQVCMNVLPMPAGARAKVHHHRDIETIAYMLIGRCAVYYGDALEDRVMLETGDQIYIPGSVPHAPCNESDAACTWLVVHATGSDQDDIVLLPDLDAVLAARSSKA